MTWKMHIEFTFFLPGRGRVVIGRPDGDPVKGPVTVEAHGETHEAEVVGIEWFRRGDHRGENCGLLLQGADGSDLSGAWDVAEGTVTGRTADIAEAV